MQETTAAQYFMDRQQEWEHQETQAVLAGIKSHLRYLSAPKQAHILDAGCGSGSMTRLLGATYPDAKVVGLDVVANLLVLARERASAKGLTNVSFQDGDVQNLPFGDATFDLIWSKYVLYFLPDPERAIREFRRVTKPGGNIIIVLNYWPGLVLEPEDIYLTDSIRLLQEVVNLSLPAKLPRMLMQTGFANVSVEMEADKVFSVVGPADPQRQQSVHAVLSVARQYSAQALGSEAAVDQLLDRTLPSFAGKSLI